MKCSTAASIALAALISTAHANVIVVDRRQDAAPPAKGKMGGGASGGTTMNQVTQGGCKGTVMIFARGSTEPGNVGFLIGPPVFTAVSKGLGGDFAVEGVPYAASIGPNMQPGGTDQDSINKATKLFTEIHAKCPQSVIIAGGYSQGAALMHRTVEKLPKEIQDHIAAVILYGDTKNTQDGGHIKDFPKEKSKVFCNGNDGVCGGGLNVNGGHLSYSASIQPGANWLISMVKKYKKEKGLPDNSPPLDPSAPVDPPAGSYVEGKLNGGAAKGSSPKGPAPKGFSPKGAPPKGMSPPAAPAAPAGGMEGMSHGGMEGMSHGSR